MRRKRVTGRFYVFLLAILVIAFLIVRPHLRFGTREAIIEPGYGLLFAEDRRGDHPR